MEQKTGLSLMVYAHICRKCAANVSTRPNSSSTIKFTECLSASKADHEMDGNQMQMMNTQINAFVAVGLLFAEIYGIVVHCVFAASG